jgi:hypothetical protein
VSVGGLFAPFGSVIGLIQGEGASYTVRLPFTMSIDEVTGTSGPGMAPEPALPPLPPDTAEGSASFDGQQLSVTHGLAWWDAGREQVRVALFAQEPPPGMLAALRAGSWGDGGPVVQVHLEVPGGVATAAAPDAYCYVGTSFPRGGAISFNTSAKECGLSGLAGEITAGGQVTARLQGESQGPADKMVSWQLRFNLPIAP